MSVSLDGYFEGPDGDISWHLVDEELHTFFNDRLRDAGAFLEGRRTHELMAAFWPTADEDPNSPQPMIEFAEIWRSIPHYVFSRTVDEAEWATRILRKVDPREIESIRDAASSDLFVGGAELAAEFLRHDLIDEHRIFVHPVVIGRGRSLYPESHRRQILRLVDSRVFGNGVVMLRYLTPR
jgi:dihydrofolate reductase